MNIGIIVIATAMMLSAASAIFFLRSRNGSVAMQINTGRRLYYITSSLIFFSVLLLLSFLLNNEFQYAYIYNYSSVALSIPYKISALWAGSEGSYLIWTFMLNIMGLLLIIKKSRDEDILLSVTALMQALMLLIVLVKSPFVKVWAVNQFIQTGMIPGDGQGMKAILMDPWMIAHPPVLFLGYASAAIIFAYAITALVRKNFDSWIDPAYKWLIFSVFTLGLGIFMGGYWAYTVLGWGGYWGWDPVENSSLVPWLISIALLHTMILQKRRSVLKKSNIALSLLYFILVFYSTFLTRSGVLSDFSVHSFEESDLKIYLGIILAIFIIISAAAFIRRFKNIKSEKLREEFYNLENMTVFGIIVLLFFSLIILSGTSMPIVTRLAGKNPVPVTTYFYNNFSIPMGIFLLLFIILSAISSVKYSRIVLAVTVSTSLIISAGVNVLLGTSAVVLAFLSLSLLLGQLMVYDIYTKGKGVILSSRTAHLGIALMITGIIISGYYSQSEQVQINTGETIKFRDTTIRLNGYTDKPEPSILLTINNNNRSRDTFLPYTVDESMKPVYKEPRLLYGFAGDLYISPEDYSFSSIEYGTEIFEKGETKDINGYRVKFTGFEIKNMGKADMSVYAKLLINDREFRPGLYLLNDEVKSSNVKIQGTDRIVSLENIVVKHEVAVIRISPSAKDVIPPDYAILNVSFKRLIWLVWLGTILISAGFVITMTRLYRAENDR